MESDKPWFVVDEGDEMYNVFSYYDFDEDGYYSGHEGEEGYHLSDFDIVFECKHFTDAERWIEIHKKI